ncbi:MAG TPA: hypothetical protein DF712_21405 [Balneola sp.]|nr:hypothetical protein [Balneola sp.]
MKKTAFASFCESYNNPYDKREKKELDKRIADCTRHMNICTECNSVYEFRSPTVGRGSMRVIKYSQLPKLGFPKKVCQNCLDDTVLVEQY